MNSSVTSAQFRLAALWLAVFARVVGENSARTYAVLQVHEFSLGFLFALLGTAAVPAFALAPLIGAAASSKARWPVMVLSTLVGLGAIVWSSVEEYRTGQTFWLGCIGLLAFEAAFFSACRFAMLPEVVRAAKTSLPQTIGIFSLAIGAGIGVGIWVGITQFEVGKPGLPVPLMVGVSSYGIALITILLGKFAVQKPIRFNDGLIKPFLKTAKAILVTRNGRHSLIALWGVFAVGLVVNQWLFPRDEQRAFFLCLVVGLVIGSLHGNAFRTLGLAPYAATGLAVSAIWAIATDNWYEPALAAAVFLGCLFPPLLTTYTIYQPDELRGHGGALLHCGWAVIVGMFLIFLVAFLADPPQSRPLASTFVVGLSIAVALFSWCVFFRPTFEMTWEIILWPVYRVKAIGPGVSELPWKGPALVIANHSAWFDPLWLDKVLPFPTKPMMTSRFYDLPGLSWIFRHVIDAIRVPDAIHRKEAPELAEAIAALDRGECLVVFPEGWLRRKEEQYLRRFARGIWHILHARPDTPVFPCWIEGGWGSMFSHKYGPPMKNGKIDFWRTIRIGIGAPEKLSPEILKAHMATRIHLMKAVIQARSALGLPEIDPFKLPAHDDEADKPAEDPEGAA